MNQKPATFYCFSPLVMLTTFVIEVALLVLVVWRYKLNTITRLVVLLLLFLAGFQLAEFMICEGDPERAVMWSRIGFVAITMLPPLGVHLAYALAGAKKRPFVVPSYAAAAAFVVFFAFVSGSLDGHACSGNYIIFQLAEGAGLLYGTYYYGLLALGIGVALHFYRAHRNKRIRRALLGLIVGYLVFIVPTATVNLINPETIEAIPSIMCGFAVFLALLLALVIMPVMAKRRR